MILVYSFLVGLFLTIIILPVLAKAAWSLGIVDHPGGRKVHATPIPRVGGVAIAISGGLSVVLWAPDNKILLYYGASALLILFAGILDDIRNLDYRWKLLVQSLGIAVLLASGFRMTYLPFFGLEPIPGYIAYPVSFLFLLGVTNAVNLFDGLDGLAGGCIVLSFAAMSFLAHIADDLFVSILGMAVIGGVVGFLRYNTHPAVIFMGDAGSQFLGFTAGFLAIYLTSRSNTALNPVLPFVILGLPIIDTVAIAIRRLLQKRSPFIGDRQHLHHRLLKIGLSHVQTVSLLYAIQIVMVALAIGTRYQRDILVFSAYFTLGISIFLVLYLIERRNINKNTKAPELNGVNTSTYFEYLTEKLAPAGKLSFALLAPFIYLYLFFVTLVSYDTTDNLAVISISIAISTLVGFFFLKKFQAFFLKLCVYFACLTATFLFIPNIQSSYQYEVLAEVFLVTLIGLVLIAMIFSNEHRFGVSPQDLLMLTLVITVPILPAKFFGNFPVRLFVLQVATLFYAVEYIIVARDRIPYGLFGGAVGVLGLVGLRAFL